MNHILYRARKAVANENDSIGLTVEEVINMISDLSVISSVELRNEIDGSWMRTSFDKGLLDLINQEIIDKDILSFGEMEEDQKLIQAIEFWLTSCWRMEQYFICSISWNQILLIFSGIYRNI